MAGNSIKGKRVESSSRRTTRDAGRRAARLMALSALTLIFSAASMAQPNASDATDDDTVTPPVSQEAADRPDRNGSKITILPAFEEASDEPDEDTPESSSTTASPAEAPSTSRNGTDRVYRSREFKEYHWQRDCALIGEGEPTIIPLTKAKEDGLIGCGVCRRQPDEKTRNEDGSERPYLGNRRLVDNTWRVRQTTDLEKPLRLNWRYDSQTNAIWRAGVTNDPGQN